MKRADERANGVLRFVCDVLLAGTLASACLTKLLFSSETRWSAQFFGWQMGFNHTFHRSVHSEIGQNLAFCAFGAVLTAIGVLALRALWQVQFAERTIRRVLVAVAVGTPPVCLWLVARYRLHESRPFSARLSLEAFAAVLFALLCAWNRRAIPLTVTAAVLALHCAFWFYYFAGTLEVFALCWKITPVIAYFSAVASAYYTRRCRL